MSDTVYKIQFSNTSNEHRNNRKFRTTVLICDYMLLYNMTFDRHGTQQIYNNMSYALETIYFNEIAVVK